ncbi:beta-hexosaminidase subunit beta [Elysia marginata]|uniref:Beta-hexosaminidase subunit beta n=1 Tax=Elysia marginata TaxID=1093978 RepID=A0AAV4JY76_9GAST|nr:beta-hexosaminidase subunit beta [Elysia marginata]
MLNGHSFVFLIANLCFNFCVKTMLDQNLVHVYLPFAYVITLITDANRVNLEQFTDEGIIEDVKGLYLRDPRRFMAARPDNSACASGHHCIKYSLPKDSNYVDTPTVGQPWPMPVRYDTTAETVSLDAKNFQFKSIGVHCDILEAAYTRYKSLTFRGYRVVKPDPSVKGNLNTLNVFVKNSCSGKIYPSLNSSEFYKLIVSSSHASLDADEVWGALRGLETFSQIVYRKESGEV